MFPCNTDRGVRTAHWTGHLQVKWSRQYYISAKMLKSIAVSIALTIAQLLNLSIRLGKAPNAWKLSFIVPIPTSANYKTHEPNNYRPISLVCILSKLLEKHIHSLMVSHLEELSDCQWGFRVGRSTTTALLSATLSSNITCLPPSLSPFTSFSVLYPSLPYFPPPSLLPTSLPLYLCPTSESSSDTKLFLSIVRPHLE